MARIGAGIRLRAQGRRYGTIQDTRPRSWHTHVAAVETPGSWPNAGMAARIGQGLGLLGRAVPAGHSRQGQDPPYALQRPSHHGQPAPPGPRHPAAGRGHLIAAALRCHARRPGRPLQTIMKCVRLCRGRGGRTGLLAEAARMSWPRRGKPDDEMPAGDRIAVPPRQTRYPPSDNVEVTADQAAIRSVLGRSICPHTVPNRKRARAAPRRRCRRSV